MRKEGKQEWHGVKSLEMLLKMDNRTLRKLFAKKYFWLDNSDTESKSFVFKIDSDTFDSIDKVIQAFEELEKMSRRDIIVCRYVFSHLLRQCRQ